MLCESMQCTCKKENDKLVSYTPLAALDCQMLMSINYAENCTAMEWKEYNYTCSIFLHTFIFPLPINWKIHKKQYGIWTTYFKRYDTQVFFFSQWQVKNQFNKMKWQNPGPYLYSSHCVTVLIISFNWNYDSPQKSPTETSLM